MRTGEVLALTWDDINFEDNKIRINKTVYAKEKDNKGRWYLGSTKTKGSTREIYMCNTLKNVLINLKRSQENNNRKLKRKYHKYCLEEIKNKYNIITEYRIIEYKNKSKNKNYVDLVFTKENGSYSGTDLLRYPFSIIHKELKITNCRFYDLRGSYATTMLRNGIQIKDVAEILGHSRVETTQNYYISSFEESKKYASEVFERNLQSKIIDDIIDTNI